MQSAAHGKASLPQLRPLTQSGSDESSQPLWDCQPPLGAIGGLWHGRIPQPKPASACSLRGKGFLHAGPQAVNADRRESQAKFCSVQHGIQLVSQGIKHGADVVQNVLGGWPCGAILFLRANVLLSCPQCGFQG